jgi:hypothetical protein
MVHRTAALDARTTSETLEGAVIYTGVNPNSYEVMPEQEQLVAPPVGTIVHANDQGYFRVKGLKNVRVVFSLSCLADNLRRGRNQYP